MDERTRLDIEKRTWQVLKDAGLTEPPIKVEDVILHLKLNLDFYSLKDPSFLRRLHHKFDVRTQKMLQAVQNSKIVAAWFPESSKILIDDSLPSIKKTFPQFHETVHSILPWHKDFYLGDTTQSLHPQYQESLEFEANYGASELWFCGPNFRSISADFDLTWESVPKLKEMFGTTLTTTLWKFIVSQPNRCVVGLISTPPNSAAGAFSEDRCRYFIRSPSAEKKFSKLERSIVLAQVESKIQKRRGGPLGTFEIHLADDNGALHIFTGETFSNTHDLLTILNKKSP